MTKQQEVLKYLSTVESADISEIYHNCDSFNYHANAKKHTGAVLSTMVKNQSIIRIKPGVFAINKDIKIVKYRKKQETQKEKLF